MQKILEKVLCGIFEKKSALHERALFVRRLRDSNPRYACRTPVFKTGAIDQLCQTSKVVANLRFSFQSCSLGLKVSLRAVCEFVTTSN